MTPGRGHIVACHAGRGHPRPRRVRCVGRGHHLVGATVEWRLSRRDHHPLEWLMATVGGLQFLPSIGTETSPAPARLPVLAYMLGMTACQCSNPPTAHHEGAVVVAGPCPNMVRRVLPVVVLTQSKSLTTNIILPVEERPSRLHECWRWSWCVELPKERGSRATTSSP